VTVLYARLLKDGVRVGCAWPSCSGVVGMVGAGSYMRDAPERLYFTIAAGYVDAGTKDNLPLFRLARKAEERMHKRRRAPVLKRRGEVAFAPTKLPSWIECPECDAMMMLDGAHLGDPGMLGIQNFIVPRVSA
jgi:hypothetical protein